MYKVKGKPWAYSGAIDVSDCATAKEVMLKAGLNFDVAKCELVGKMPIKLTGTEDRKSTRLNSSHSAKSRMPSSA